ncbi:DUF4278 domain-containing protein [Spirulina sp. CS-785/01]|uniref:arginine synthesis PII-interacting regulator PirA n=1 Tax=Spirulina sp. CS-785/01 TaxID=3021716 RepID=UPI00232B5F5D|nr:DUF4278 domain-containing protein [Spirulina sp. CS-785/01]MDB9312057.1 DUF4278 domain-containing protein [Spirulina sp. CS-785/01]
MELSYRGVRYNREPLSLEVSEGELLTGKYRGQQYHRQFPRHIPVLKEKPTLKYRGVAYKSCPIIQTEATLQTQLAAITASANKVQSKSRSSVVPTATSTHLDNLRQNLERRLQVAKERGDEQLVRLLEEESKQLAL